MKEIPLKQWVTEEVAREKVGANAIYSRLSLGRYPKLKLRRENKRVVWVQWPAADKLVK